MMIMIVSVNDGDDDVIHVYVYLNDIHLLIWISLNGHHFVILSLSSFPQICHPGWRHPSPDVSGAWSMRATSCKALRPWVRVVSPRFDFVRKNRRCVAFFCWELQRYKHRGWGLCDPAVAVVAGWLVLLCVCFFSGWVIWRMTKFEVFIWFLVQLVLFEWRMVYRSPTCRSHPWVPVDQRNNKKQLRFWFNFICIARSFLLGDELKHSPSLFNLKQIARKRLKSHPLSW